MNEWDQNKPPNGYTTSFRVEKPYNPLEKSNLAISIENALLERPIQRLPPCQGSIGGCIYAIYYFGDHPLYEKLSDHKHPSSDLIPIYVGKAHSRAGQKGLNIGGFSTAVLYDRLSQHGRSIKSATNLRIEDFRCRYLVVDDTFIPLGESCSLPVFPSLE